MPNQPTAKPKTTGNLKDLFLLFAVPVAIGLLTAAFIYIPRALAHPKYNFVYSYCASFDCGFDYSVNAHGQIDTEMTNSITQESLGPPATLRYYDASSDSSRSLTYDQARAYRLNTSSKSPDGYTLVQADSSSGFLFWGSTDEGWYLKNGSVRKPIELSVDGTAPNQIKFLGWVTK